MSSIFYTPQKWFFSLLLFLCISSSVFASNDDLRIGKVEIIVHKVSPRGSFDPLAIKQRLNTQIDNTFSQEAFDEDLKTLSKDFDRVEPEVEYLQNEVFIKINLWPRPDIRNVDFEGNDKISTKRLNEELGIKPYTAFNRPQFLSAFQKLKNYYLKKGYFESELTYKLVPDPVTNEIDITIKIKEGRSGYVRNINFRGISENEEDDLLKLMITKEYNFFISWVTNEGLFNEEQVEKDKLSIIEYFHNKGFADATVNIKILDVPGKDRVDFLINIDKNEPYYFGDISSTGCKLFSEEKMSSYLGKFIAKSDPYSPMKLRVIYLTSMEKKGTLTLLLTTFLNSMRLEIFTL